MFFTFSKGRSPLKVECYFLNVQAEAQLHAVTSDCYVSKKPGFHTDPAYSLAQFLPLVLSRRVVRATARDPPLRSTKGEKEECTEGRVCQVSLRAGMCSPSELSDRTHSMSPTHKGERTHETRVRRTTLTTCYTDTSGNSESVRAPRTARSTTRACSHTSLCRSCLSNAHHLPPRPPSLW